VEVEILHRVPRSLGEVERTLLDPRFVGALVEACPALDGGAVLAYDVSPGSVERVARFVAAEGVLVGPFSRLAAVAWTERVRWSLAEHEGHFSVEPDVPGALARRVRCGGLYRLEAVSDGATDRRIAVSLTVRAPLVGELAERALEGMLRSIFESEAAVLAAGLR
jgi:hypothetical protein